MGNRILLAWTGWISLAVVAIAGALLQIRPSEADTPVPEGKAFSPVTSQARDAFAALVDATALEGGYRRPSEQEVQASRMLFELLLQNGATPAVAAELREIGFAVEKINLGGEVLTLLREAADDRTGKGVFILREKAEYEQTHDQTLLQAPHRFHDIGTGDILVNLMAGGPFRAAALNTAPRWEERGGERVETDLAREQSSHFNAFGEAFASIHPEGRVVQIHGFARGKRESEAGAAAAAIVSSGARRPNETTIEVSNCLRDALAPELVLLYPWEVSELGATTNLNGRRLRGMGFDGFVHVELSRELRDSLLEEPQLLHELENCFANGNGK